MSSYQDVKWELCHLCQSAFDQLPEDEAPRSGHKSLKQPHCKSIFELEASAENGCPMCTQFFHRLIFYHQNNLRDLQEATSIAFSCGIKVQPALFDLQYSTGENFDNLIADADIWISISLVFDFPEDPAAHYKAYKTVRADVQVVPCTKGEVENPIPTFVRQHSLESLSMAKGWLETCATKHTTCQSSDKYTMPTRLVHVERSRIHLCISSELQECPRYATLSHCWGDLKLVNLTKDNFKSFCDEIPSSALSRTYSDAFKIIRYLEIDYIWIDSLCIMQDDPLDWHKESALMSEIYSNGFINISASVARNGREGCFPPRDTGRILMHQLKTSSPTCSKMYKCVAEDFATQALCEASITFRAWVLQEDLLSPRTLYCASTQLFWECREVQCCELFPTCIPNSFKTFSTRISKQQIVRTLWPEIIDAYTRRDLTVEGDKLVAISGLARKIQALCKDEYLAGLWRKGIEDQLCWKSIHSSSRPCKGIGTYRAPSWSWAGGCDSPIASFSNISLGHKKLRVQFLDACITYVQQNSLGAVTEAKLKLGCSELLYGTVVSKNGGRGGQALIGDISIVCDIILDCPTHRESVYGNWFYILPVEDYEGQPFMRCLILIPTGRAQGEYRRVGIFETLEPGNEYLFPGAEIDFNRDSYYALRGVISARDGHATGPDFSEIYEKDGKVIRVIDLV